MNYPAIEDHGLIGDLQTAALVSTDGTVNWMCLPRFDSPGVFAALLDSRRGGRFILAPVGSRHVTKQMYLPNTAILVTRFLSPGGVAEVVDFMPIENPAVATDRYLLIRMVRGIRGEMTLEARVEPRFGYARATHKTGVTETGAVFDGESASLALSSTWPVEADGDDARARFTVKAGQTGAMILEHGKSPHPATIVPRQLERSFIETSEYWRNCERSGRLEEARLTFEKMLTYGNHLGLFSAEIGVTGEQFGNFPQAFTHLSLINAAINLDHQLDLDRARHAA